MQVSLSIKSGYGPHVTARSAAAQFLERVELADELGFDGLFVGDHHVTATTYLQNVPVLARALAAWGPRPVGALFLLPLWPPVLLAEQIGTLAAMSGAPFVLQCALGGGETQFAGMGVALADRRRLFETHLDVVTRLLRGEAVATGSPHGASASIDPVPDEPVEVWIGAHGPPAIDRAARLGDAWYAAPRHTVGELTTLMGTYRQACERHGAEPARVPVRRDVHVAADASEAERVRAEVAASGHRGFDPQAVIVGEVGEVAEAFAELAEIGFTEVVARQLAVDHAGAMASLQRLGDVRAEVAELPVAPLSGGRQ